MMNCYFTETISCHETPTPVLNLPGVSSVSLGCYGTWTLVMRRADPTFDFNKGWLDYKYGFGSIDQDYWAGNFILFYLTKSRRFYMRVDIWADDGYFYNAEFEQVDVLDETKKFQIRVNRYIGGSASDGGMVKYHSEVFFSTKDNDNTAEKKCVEKKSGGWWYVKDDQCQEGKLTGQIDDTLQGSVWTTKRGYIIHPVKTIIRVKPSQPDESMWSLLLLIISIVFVMNIY